MAPLRAYDIVQTMSAGEQRKDSRNLLAPGSRLSHYSIIEHIATGGMGSVYKAFEPALQRHVAIKVLRPDFALNEEYSQMFEDEARAIAALRHPHIVPIYYIGREHGIIFFAMPLIEGSDCQELLNAHGRLPHAYVLQITLQAVDALAEACKRHIVHRDIKPSNLMIERDSGRLLLTDFGLAKCLDFAGGDDKAAGWGSPGYVCPEQIRRQPTDFRSDMYSLGATLFHLMTGATPYESTKTSDELRGHLDRPFPYQQAVECRMPPGWIAVLERMLKKKPEERFGSYQELLDALNHMDEVTEYVPTKDITVLPVAQRPEWRPERLNGLVVTDTRDLLKFSKDFSSQVTPQHIQKALSLPTLDPWADQLREISERQRGSLRDLSEFASEVPDFGDFMVRLGGSGWFGADQAINGVEDAVDAVGLDLSATLALITLFVGESSGSGKNFDWRMLWRHSVTVGLLADRLTEYFGLDHTGFELQAGFLHDVGKVVLGDIVPMSVIATMRKSFDDRRDLCECEKESMHMDHPAAGVVWAAKERLSTAAIETIATHHDPGQARKFPGLVAAVSLANHLAKRFGLGYSGSGILDTPHIEEQPGLLRLVELSGESLDLAAFQDNLVSQIPHFPVMLLED